MTSYRILVLDLNPISSPEDNCKQLPELIRKVLPSRELYLQVITHFPPRPVDFLPNLIFLRSTAGSLAKVILHLRKHWNNASIIGVFSEEIDYPKDVFQSLVSGLDDFVSCPLKEIDLYPRILRLCQREDKKVAFPNARTILETFHQERLVGESRCFLSVIEKISHLARSDATVTVFGETGTGKDLIARAIHYNSSRHGKPFIPINCSALPESLIENELFGHERGAFTGASFAEKGLIAEAEGGSIFFDEIDTLSLSAQSKLLRFLQDKKYRHLGSSTLRDANVRIIVATNKDLKQMVEAKAFREDLYHRLNVLSVTLPSLRDRVSDIPLLANHFLARYASQYNRSPLRLSGETLQKLMVYPWSGNIRELEGVIHRAVLLSASSIIQAADIDLHLQHQKESLESSSFQATKARVISQFEQSYLTNLLIAHKGNVTHAARTAGKERKAFQRLLLKYNLIGHNFRTQLG